MKPKRRNEPRSKSSDRKGNAKSGKWHSVPLQNLELTESVGSLHRTLRIDTGDEVKPKTHDAESTRLQVQILDLLLRLERDGCQCVPREEGVVLRFDYGVPERLILAWLAAPKDAFDAAIWHLRRSKMIQSKLQKDWPFPSVCHFCADDGRRFVMTDWTDANAIGRAAGKVPSRWIVVRRKPARSAPALSGASERLMKWGIMAIPPKQGQMARMFMSADGVDHFGTFHRIARRGHAYLASNSGLLAESPLVTLSEVAPLTGWKKRTLERKLKQLPDPDVYGGGGRSHFWFWDNLRPALSKICGRLLPALFPASRLIPGRRRPPT